MDKIIDQMMVWGSKYIGDGAFFGMALISCVFLYITSQKDRKRIVYLRGTKTERIWKVGQRLS